MLLTCAIAWQAERRDAADRNARKLKTMPTCTPLSLSHSLTLTLSLLHYLTLALSHSRTLELSHSLTLSRLGVHEHLGV